jgi:hypothetical protein
MVLSVSAVAYDVDYDPQPEHRGKNVADDAQGRETGQKRLDARRDDQG